MYIYDNADIILSEFMFSRWDATFKNQTEYNRLKNGGITQVCNWAEIYGSQAEQRWPDHP